MQNKWVRSPPPPPPTGIFDQHPWYGAERTLFIFCSAIAPPHSSQRRSIHFSDMGGGGGTRVRKNFKFSSKSRNIKLRAERHRKNWKLCMFSSIFNVKFNGFVVPDSAVLNLFLHYIPYFFAQVVEIIVGGGGGGKTTCLPPQYFHWATTPPPPDFFCLSAQLSCTPSQKIVPRALTACTLLYLHVWYFF